MRTAPPPCAHTPVWWSELLAIYMQVDLHGMLVEDALGRAGAVACTARF